MSCSSFNEVLPGMDAIVTGLSTIVKLRSYNTVHMW